MKAVRWILTTTTAVFWMLLTKSLAQEAKSIPVYPAATMVVEKEESVEPVCCDFVTTDSFEKVLSFYEGKLKSKPMDIATLGTKYPSMKEQVTQLEKQLPAASKFRAFVLEEVTMNGKKGAVLFELLSASGKVSFAIPEGSFTPNDQHFVSEWRERSGKASSSEIASKKIIDWTRLKDYLPTVRLEGYTRGEPEGETERREDGTSTSSARVIYTKLLRAATGGEEGSPAWYATMTVTIEDCVGNTDYSHQAIVAEGPDEKSVKVKGIFGGKERTSGTAEHGEAEKTFLVNDRFLVSVHTQPMKEFSIIDKLIEGMDLAHLANLK